MEGVEYLCVVAGVGPAGAGFLFNLHAARIFERTASRVLAIERSDVLGAGRLGDYKISANSLGKAFLECLEGPIPHAAIQGSVPGGELQRRADEAPSLVTAAKGVSLGTEALVAHLSSQRRIDVRRSSTLTTIQHRTDRGFEVRWQDRAGRLCRATTASVAFNFGGRQTTAQARRSLAPWVGESAIAGVSVHLSDDVLRMTPNALRATIGPELVKSRRLTLLGGSHSAFSVLDRLTEVFDADMLERIAILARSPIKLYFASTGAAAAARYAFDAVMDVCPLSGRVNRFGGLRYRAKEVADTVLDRREFRGRTVEIFGDADKAAAAQYLRGDAGTCVSCVGYEPVLPRILDAKGAEIRLRKNESGLVTDPLGRPVDTRGHALRGLYSFGLGSGLRPDATIGGEQSFRGRMDGVWLYHFDVGRRVIRAFIEDCSTGIYASGNSLET